MKTTIRVALALFLSVILYLFLIPSAYAAGEIVISFDPGEAGNTAGVMPSINAQIGSEVTLPNNDYYYNNHEFMGWLDQNGEGYADRGTITATENLVLTAQWKRTMYTVSYYGNGGGDPYDTYEKNQTIRVNSAVTFKNNMFTVPYGKVFICWNTTPYGNGISYYPGETRVFNEDITLYAIWKEQVEIWYYPGEGQGTAQKETVTADVPTKLMTIEELGFEAPSDDLAFAGWTHARTEDSADARYQDGAKVTIPSGATEDEKKFFAHWIDKVIVTFNPNYETAVSSYTQSVPKGQITALDINKFYRSGYFFDSWYKNKGCTGTKIENGGNINTAKNITLYAKWIGPLTIKDTVTGSDSIAYVGEPIQATIPGIMDADGVTYTWYAKQSLTSTSRMKLTNEGQTITRTTIPTYGSTEFPYIFCVASKGSKEDGTYQEIESNYILLKDFLDSVYWGMDFINDGDTTKYPNAQYHTSPGYIEGVEEGMEYSLNGGSTWTKIPASRISVGKFLVPGIGTYIIRQGGVTSDPITIYNWYVVGYTVSSSSSAGGTARMTASNSSSSSGAMPSSPVLADSTQSQRDYNTIMKLASNWDNLWAVRSDNSRSITLSVTPASFSYARVSINDTEIDFIGGNSDNSSSSSSSYSRTYAVNPVNTPKLYNVQFSSSPYSPVDKPDVAIDETNFPDPMFRNMILDQYDRNKDEVLSGEEAFLIKTLYCSNRNINSLKGVEYFFALNTLQCSSNYLSELDLRGCEVLTSLSCNANYIANLDLSGCINLVSLNCANNNLNTLDLSSCTALETLDCSSNMLSKLKLNENKALKTLSCSNNNIDSLDFSENRVLTSLTCGGNLLKRLDLSRNPSLVSVSCHDNYMTGIDVSNCPALRTLRCSGNLLTWLDLTGCPSIMTLNCQGNSIKTLLVDGCGNLYTVNCADNQLQELMLNESEKLGTVNCQNNLLRNLLISGCDSMRTLYCERNLLTELDLSGCTVLKTLYCNNNGVTTLDITDCPALIELVENKQPQTMDNYYVYGEENVYVDVFDGTTYKGHTLRVDKGVTLIYPVSSLPGNPDLILPASLTTIEDEAFIGGAFAYVKLPEGTKSIGCRAFADCPNLVCIYIPASARTIDPDAFDGADRLTIIGIPGSEAENFAHLHGFAFKAQQ